MLPRAQISPAFVWLYWLDPIAWGVRALAVSQYRNERYDVDVFAGVDYRARFNKTMGEFYLEFFDIPNETHWVGYGVAFNIVVYVLCLLLASYVLEHTRLEASEDVALPAAEGEGEGDAEKPHRDGSYAQLAIPKADGDSGGSSHTEVAVAVLVEPDKRFVPVTLAFQDLWYSVPARGDKKQQIDLLKGVSGFAKPGKMTALMALLELVRRR